MIKGTIFNIQKFCIHDGDGIRTCVFLKGCPLRCIWCHNPESFKKEPVLSFSKEKCNACGKCTTECSARTISDNALILDRNKCINCGKCKEICLNDANEIIGKEITVSEVMDEVLKDKIFYETSGGGLTVTGGEPSYQSEFTLELLRLSKENGISIAIETCGIGSQEFYKKAAELGSTFLFDIKCMDSLLHRKLTGSDNSRILSNLHFLMGIQADIIIRLPMIPDCNDSDEDIKKLCEFLNKNKDFYRYAEIMPYHSLGIGKADKTGTELLYYHNSSKDSEISRWKEIFASYDTDVIINH